MTRSDVLDKGTLDQVLAHGWRLIDADAGLALKQAQEILRINPRCADAMRLAAASLRQLGRPREAEQTELEAIRASSHNPVLVQTAQALSAGQFHEAESLIRPHLRATPNDPAALRLLAEVAAETGAEEDAEALLRNALNLAPAFNAARIRLARLLLDQNRLGETLPLLDEALSWEPDNIKAQSLKASILSRTGEYEEALALYEGVLARFPDRIAAWISYGHLLKTLGRVPDSVAAYRHAVALDPANGEAWWSLANLKTVKFTEGDISFIEAALEKEDIDAPHRLQLHFALGKALEDEKAFAESFHHYAAGNEIKREMLGYDAAATEMHVSRSIEIFTREFFDQRQDWGCPAEDPIFVVGLPRAGSTLVEQILASHPLIEGTSELLHLPTLIHKLTKGHGSYLVNVSKLTREESRKLGEKYLHNSRIHRKTDKPYFVDKLPNNWMHIGLIRLILPNARIIDARRHPLACCFSNYKQHFAHGQAFTYSLEDVARYYVYYARLLHHFDQVTPRRLTRVIHEDLVAEPEAGIRALLKESEFEFAPGCLTFYQNERAVRTPSAEQVRRPINRDGLEQWKPYESWLRPLKDVLGPVLEDYPMVPPSWN